VEFAFWGTTLHADFQHKHALDYVGGIKRVDVASTFGL